MSLHHPFCVGARHRVTAVTIDPDDLPATVAAFLDERHLGLLTTVRPDQTLHACAVGFTYDRTARVVRVICGGHSVKARNAATGCRAVVGQVDGGRWLSLEGLARTVTDADAVAEAVSRYARRYRMPGPDPGRAVIELRVERILGRA